MTTRLFFVGNDRIADAVLTLKFDQFVAPFLTKTVIHHQSPVEELYAAFNKFGIDPSKFTFVSDDQLLNQYPYTKEISLRTVMPSAWYTQQIIKLLALDSCDDEQVVIVDCDMFSITPKNYFSNNEPVLWYNDPLDDLVHWNAYYEVLTQLPSEKDISFVGEALPILKSDWRALKNKIESVHNQNWLEIIIYLITQGRKILPLLTTFSEYQLLGNWILNQRLKTVLVKQSRHAIHENLFSGNYDCMSIERISFNDIRQLETLVNEYIEFKSK